MSDFKHAIAKKYYGTMFESSLAVAGGVCLPCCCPTKPPKIKPRDVPGALIERGSPDPPCWGSLWAAHTQMPLVWKPSAARLGVQSVLVPGCQQTGGCCHTWDWLEKQCSVWAWNTIGFIPANTGKGITRELLSNLGKVCFDQNEIHMNNLLL